MRVLTPGRGVIETNPFDSGEYVDMSTLDYRPDGLGWVLQAIQGAAAVYGVYTMKRSADRQKADQKRAGRLAELQLLADKEALAQTQTAAPVTTPALNMTSPLFLVGGLLASLLVIKAVKK